MKSLKMTDSSEERQPENRLKTENQLLQHNKQHHRRVLLSSFHLIGHTLGFHPQNQKIKPKDSTAQ